MNLTKFHPRDIENLGKKAIAQ